MKKESGVKPLSSLSLSLMARTIWGRRGSVYRRWNLRGRGCPV